MSQLLSGPPCNQVCEFAGGCLPACLPGGLWSGTRTGNITFEASDEVLHFGIIQEKLCSVVRLGAGREREGEKENEKAVPFLFNTTQLSQGARGGGG